MTSESDDVPINSESRVTIKRRLCFRSFKKGRQRYRAMINSLALRIPYIFNVFIKLRGSVLEVCFEETK